MGTLGTNIKALRKKKKITQRELAEMIGVNEVTVRSYESDKYNPKTDVIMKLCVALDCKVSDIIDDENQKYYRMFDEHLKDLWKNIQDSDQKRQELLIEFLKTHNYKIKEKDIRWLIVTDYQGFSFLVSKSEFQEMALRCDKDIRYNIEKLLNGSRDYQE